MTGKRKWAGLAIVVLLLSAGICRQGASEDPPAIEPGQRQKLLADLETAKQNEQKAAAAAVRKLEMKAADIEKRLARVRKSRNAKPETVQKFEAEAAQVKADLETNKSKPAELDQQYEQKRRRIMWANKLPGDPPLFEQDGQILTKEEMDAAIADANRPKPSPEQIAKVKALLSKARRLLAERELNAAEAAVAEARQAAGSFDMDDVLAPTEALLHYVGEFWKAYEEALPGVAGKELQVGEVIIFVISARRDEVLIRKSGSNVSFDRKTVPAGLARKIAETWLANQASSRAILGAFLATDPKLIANRGREKARALWKEAAAGKVDVSQLVKVLDEPM